MTHVITQSCCNDAACVPVCPANCIHPTPDEPEYLRTEMLFIDATSCVDCGACIQQCPVDAIVPHDELTPLTERYLELNALYFERHPREAKDDTDPTITRRGKGVPERPEAGTSGGALRVAIVGSGPSACYASEDLLNRHADVEVHMYERLPTPWGLVRAGVAPDHPDTKGVTRTFERTAAHPKFHFHLNIEVGVDVSHEELAANHHAVIYAVGAHKDRRLEVPGEDLRSSHSATEFVAWYNGHPEAAGRSFDLSGDRAVIVGNGNVALDVARVLLSDVAKLAKTDIADHALAALADSNIHEVVVLGRRGPGQAAYTAPELLALEYMTDIDVIVDADEAELDSVTRDWLSRNTDPTAEFKAAVVADYVNLPRRADRRIVLRYLTSPVEIVGENAVQGVSVVRNTLRESVDGRVEAVATNDVDMIECGLVLRSVGYRGEPLAGIPFDDKRGVFPNQAGRVIDPDAGEIVPGLYVTGWIKRGPSGVIGTNKRCAKETVANLLEDHAEGILRVPETTTEEWNAIVAASQEHALQLSDWMAIDEFERSSAQLGRPRVKMVDTGLMLDVAKTRRSEIAAVANDSTGATP
jgi:ferredoxin--NADP+ reductase